MFSDARLLNPAEIKATNGILFYQPNDDSADTQYNKNCTTVLNRFKTNLSSNRKKKGHKTYGTGMEKIRFPKKSSILLNCGFSFLFTKVRATPSDWALAVRPILCT